MMFYTGNPDIRQYEQRAREARAAVVTDLVQRLRHGVSALLRRPTPAQDRHPNRVACQD